MAKIPGGQGESIPWAPLAEAMTAGGEEDRHISTPQGDVWAVFTPVPSSDWSFAVILPEEKMMQSLKQYLQGEATVFLVAFVLVMLVIVVVSLMLTRRLKSLTRTIRQVELGNHYAQVPGRLGQDEIGDASRAFNQMMDRWQERDEAGD